jgi:hypothetical protein
MTETGLLGGTRAINLGFNESTLALLASAVLLVGAVLWGARGPLTEKTDFSLTYVGARIVYQGQGARLYDLGKQKEVRDSLFQHPNPLVFEHPPFEALFLSPLAGLPYRTAYLVWGLANVLVWLSLPVLLRPYTPAPRDALTYLALWLLFAPLGVALFQGQSSLFLLLLFAVEFVQLKRGRELPAGIWLGLGLFKFQFVLPFALIFLLRAKWKFLAGFTISAAVLGVLSWIAVGWVGLFQYVHLLLAVGANPQNLSYGAAVDMPTLHGFAHAVLGRIASPAVISGVVAISSLVLIVFMAWRWRQQDAKPEGCSFDLMFAAALTVSLMTGVHMFTHDFSPLMLALLLVCAHLSGKTRRGLRTILGAALAIFWFPPVYFALVTWHCLYLMFPLLLAFTLAAIALSRVPTEGLVLQERHVPAQ